MLGSIVLVAVAALVAALLLLWFYGERWRPLRRSSWKLMTEAGLRRVLNLSAPHGYVYGRWTNEYVHVLMNHIMPRLGPRGKQWLADRYHGKVLTQDQAEAIITIEQEIPLRDLEQIIPYPKARELVLKGPPDLGVWECPCRRIRDNPCEPTQVCMIIGQSFVDYHMEHNPELTRRITQGEALELLREEHERGHFHSAWFKDACLDRFYALCNCCKCCCGGIQAMVKYGTPMVAPSGYISRVDETRCSGCGTCEEVCPFGAIQVDDAAVVIWDKCMGCGVCVGQCRDDAVSLVRDEGKGIPLDVRALAQEQVVS